MSAMKSQSDTGFWGCFERLGRHLFAGMLMVLPLGGLIFFFEATRPAQLRGGEAAAAQFSTSSMAGADFLTRQRHGIPRFEGVSAELRQNSFPPADAKEFSVADAERALGRGTIASLNPGVEAEFVTRDNRRVAVRVVSREPIVDQAVPDNSRVMEIAPASTAAMISFVWGPWLYRVEVQDKGIEPKVVVQKML
jgi:hypothetical protein